MHCYQLRSALRGMLPWGVFCLLTAWVATPGTAQTIIRRSFVGTAQSALIEAQADFIVSQGIFLRSAAEARKLNAEAAEAEMKNSVLWIHTYFERRRLNKEYREAEHPGFQELERRRTELARKILKVSPELVLQGDITNDLNMMLHDMLANVSFEAFMPDGELMSAPENYVFTPQEIHQLLLSETKDSQGRALVFRADEADLLVVQWPFMLREPIYEAVRREFESARDEAIATMTQGKELENAQEKRLMNAVDALADKLNHSFDSTDQPWQQVQMYNSAKRYIQTLALSTYRMIEIGRDAVANDSRKFKGKSVVELLQHMMSQGLEFAQPTAGSEGTYRKLFSLVRTIYLQTNPGAAAAAEQEKQEGKKREQDDRNRAREKDLFGK